MIPKTIHYCWFGGKPLPKEVESCIKSWKKYCPDYKIIQWNEENFDIRSHPFIENAYKNKYWAFVSDYVRLRVIYENGGIYLDTDVEIIKNLDPLLRNKCYFGVEQGCEMVASGLGFGAEKGHPAILEMIKIYDEYIFDVERVMEISCPVLNTEALKKYGVVYNNELVVCNNVTIYPPLYFDPYSPETLDNLLCDETYSIHHYSASWTSWKLKRKICRFIGNTNTLKIKKIIYFIHRKGKI
ncbi:glycosyltransferase family 32 protein [Amedibacillus sp. YH-ame10]